MVEQRFAVVAKASTTGDLAAAFCARMTALTAVRFVPRVVESYEAIVDDLVHGRCELAWASPFVALEAEDRAGVALLAVVKRPFAVGYHSALFTRADSTLRSIADLAGATVAWGSPWSASAYVVPRWHLRAKGIDLRRAFGQELSFARHDAIGRAVWDRVADVGACHVGVDPVSGLLASAPWQAVTGALGAMRVLLLVGPIPADVIAATRFVAPELRRRIVSALLAMKQSDPGLGALFDATSFEPVPEGHLALLRRLARGATRPGLSAASVV